MKTTKKYLEKTSDHLFKFDSQNERENFYMKVILNEDDTFSVLKFDEELNLISNKNVDISRWEATSPAGKSYVPTELKNFVLFYKGYYGNFYKVSSVKHFKSIREKINDVLSSQKMAS